MTATEKLSKARTHLLLDQPWFGSLSMRLHLQEDPSAPTLETNGTVIRFNPEYVNSLSEAETVGVLAHETLHCALQHVYRFGGRDPGQWNAACDYAINPLLLAQGFALPGKPFIDPAYEGMSAEQIYAIRAKEQQPEDGGASKPKPEPGPGDITQPDAQPQPGQNDEQGNPAAAPQPEPMTAIDWQLATEQANAIAKKAGKLPGEVDRTLQANKESETNWREILRRFLEQTVPSDYSWTAPNRRHVAAGVYLPGVVKENTPRFVVAIDTSGSVDEELLQLFATELTQILHETRPESVEVVYCDTLVRHSEIFTPDDPEIKLNAKGGGGTRFQPVFDYVAEQDEPPAALIFFTDLENSDEIKDPGYPVLWATDDASGLEGEFGETVRLSRWQ